MQRDVAEAQQNVYEENLARQRLQMEMDSKDSEIEQLRQKLSMFNVDSASVNSGSLEDSVVEEATSGEFREREREKGQKNETKSLLVPFRVNTCLESWRCLSCFFCAPCSAKIVVQVKKSRVLFQ